MQLVTKGTIRAALTFQDLSSDTKFSPSQSRETLPLNLSSDVQNPLGAPVKGGPGGGRVVQFSTASLVAGKNTVFSDK